MPRPCCTEHSRLARGVREGERRCEKGGAGKEGLTEDDFTHRRLFRGRTEVGEVDQRDCDTTAFAWSIECAASRVDSILNRIHVPHRKHDSHSLSISPVYKHHLFRRLRQFPPPMKAASSSPSSSTARAMPHNPPRKPHYPNNLLNPDSFKRFERALAQQYAREYISKHHPNRSQNQVFKPRCVPDCAFLSYPSVAHIASPTPRRMDLCEDPNSQTITACLELPGIKPTDVEIQLHDDKLTVSGNRPAPSLSDSGAQYPVQELKYGAFRRSIDLPMGIQVGFLSISLFPNA